MPSPLAHLAAAAMAYRVTARGRDEDGVRRCRLFLMGACAGLALLPDADAVFGVMLGDLRVWHNQGFHSLAAGVVCAATAGGLATWRRVGGRRWFLLTLASFWGHLALDVFSYGRGVPLLWPFSDERFQSPWQWFRGLRWSEGLWSFEHVLTVADELGFVLLVALVLWLTRCPWRRVRDP